MISYGLNHSCFVQTIMVKYVNIMILGKRELNSPFPVIVKEKMKDRDSKNLGTGKDCTRASKPSVMLTFN